MVFAFTSQVCPAADVSEANDPAVSSKSDSLFGQTPAPIELADDNLGNSLYRMILSLVVVIGLAVGVMYASKKILPKVSGISGKRVQVIETVSLGSRRAVHLLQVGHQQILIGSTQNTITRLAELAADDADGLISDHLTENEEGAK